MNIPSHDDRAAWIAILADLKAKSGADDVALVFIHGDMMDTITTEDDGEENELDLGIIYLTPR